MGKLDTEGKMYWVEVVISMMSLIGSLNQREIFIITVIKNHYLKIIYF